jgi:paraquat-inducible protein B
VTDPSGPLPPSPPAPRVGRWTDLPWIWAVPAVAVLVGAWLAVNAVIARGPTIQISFNTGDGIEAGRTTIQYKNVVLGKVTRLGLSPDRNRVIATAEMTRDADPLLRAQTEFWVVRPQVGFSGISGL